MKLHVDVFSRPALTQAARDLVTVAAQQMKDQTYLAEAKHFLMGLYSHKIEVELIALGVYKNTEEAEKGCFHLSEDHTTLNIHGEDQKTVFQKIPLVEYSSLKTIIKEWMGEADVFNAEANELKATYTAAHKEAWNKVYTDLVTMGLETSVEEASKKEYTMVGGRFLEYNRENTFVSKLKDLIGNL